MAALDAAAQRPAIPDEVDLALEFGERAWAHPGGQRLAFGRGLEERLGSCAPGSFGGRHLAMVARPRARAATVTGRCRVQ